MDWEAILMDPVVQGAIITVAGSLALATIGGFVKILQGVINDGKAHFDLKNKSTYSRY